MPAIEPVAALPNGSTVPLLDDAAWVPPDTFERKSTKFWAHPAVVPALQVCPPLLRELELRFSVLCIHIMHNILGLSVEGSGKQVPVPAGAG